MLEPIFTFLTSIFGDLVALGYSDKVTKPGLSVIYYPGTDDIEKQLDGTTNYILRNYTVEVWHNTMQDVLNQSRRLFNLMEGTRFQISSISSVRVDGNKRKWHQEIQVTYMEDV